MKKKMKAKSLIDKMRTQLKKEEKKKELDNQKKKIILFFKKNQLTTKSYLKYHNRINRYNLTV